jgi:hypothetical protein
LVTTDELLEYSDAEGFLHLPAWAAGGIPALSVQLASGRCAWAVEERGLTRAQYREKASHEIGHCARHSFYTRLSAPTTREKCEEAARRWSYRKMVSLDDLAAAFRDGDREAWQIAERLDVPEQMVRAAAAYYRDALGLLK